MTSSAVTAFASCAGLRYVTPVTSVPSRTVLVRAASAPSSVYESNISRRCGPMSGSWKKWSITKTVSKPAASPVVAIVATVSNNRLGSTSGYVKLGICNPMRVMVEEYRSSSSSMI